MDEADALAELGEYLKLEGRSGHAAAYSRAANALREANHIPANPAAIDGIGESMRDDIAEFQQTGSIELLEELKERHEYYQRFRDVDGIGPVTARSLGDVGIRTKPQLEQAIETGEVLEVEGIGPKTAENILENL